MSSNLDPSKFWRSGSQVVSLNWQKYDKGVQMNEGLFVGTHGWVLKPEHMRKKRGLNFDDGAHAQSALQPKLRLKGHVVGVSARKYHTPFVIEPRF
jgi:phosphatidylinositol phospholipase C delta